MLHFVFSTLPAFELDAGAQSDMMRIMISSGWRLRRLGFPKAQSPRESRSGPAHSCRAWRPWRDVTITVKLASICALLAMGVVGAGAQTNLEYWAHDLKIALTGRTNGVPRTNGIIARVRADTVKFSSRDIISALANKQVFAISKGFTNLTVVVTNKVDKTNSYTTNNITMALPVFTPTTVAAYSPKARLLLLEPLGTNGLSPLIVIRDGEPPVDYNVTDYVQLSSTSFDGRTDGFVTAGRLDLAHNLLSVTDYGIPRLVFDENGFRVWPPLGTYFDVQGLDTERRFSLIEKGRVIDNSVMKSAISRVAGKGQIARTNGLAVVSGLILISGGRHQVQ